MSGSASTRVLHSRDVAGMFAKKWREKSSAYDCRASGYTWCMVLMIGRGNERKSIIATRPEQCSKTYRQCNDEANLRFPSFFFFLNFSKTRLLQVSVSPEIISPPNHINNECVNARDSG